MGMIARLGAAKVAVEARWQVEGRSERERRQVLQQAVHAASNEQASQSSVIFSHRSAAVCSSSLSL